MRAIGMGAIVPAVGPIYPNPVVASFERQAAIEAANQKENSGMNGLGCASDGISGYRTVNWAVAGTPGASFVQQGRDVLFSDVGLAGLGDMVPASFAVPQNPIMAGNGLVNSFASMRGIGALDTSSMAAFQKSLFEDKSFGYSNLLLVAGGAALLAILLGAGGGYRRR